LSTQTFMATLMSKEIKILRVALHLIAILVGVWAIKIVNRSGK